MPSIPVRGLPVGTVSESGRGNQVGLMPESD
jgi:hypothetical protein